MKIAQCVRALKDVVSDKDSTMCQSTMCHVVSEDYTSLFQKVIGCRVRAPKAIVSDEGSTMC